MAPTALHTLFDTRQFLAAMSAKTSSQLSGQNISASPLTAVMAQANLDLATVLDLLRD